MTAIKLAGKDFILPGEGYAAFEDFLYRAPSQPDLLRMNRRDIIAAYKSSVQKHKSGLTTSRRSVGGADDWDTNYQALTSYHAKHGNCSVPFGGETGSLRSWTERQKKLYARSMLESDRIKKMKALDFDFTVKQLSTRPMNNGASPLSTRSMNSTAPRAASAAKKTKPAQLEKKQSSKKQKMEVRSNSTRTATNVPMVRNSSLVIEDEATWNDQYEALKVFQAKHGNCTVPFGKETGALRSWTERQKKLYASSRLESDRVEKMTELDFF